MLGNCHRRPLTEYWAAPATVKATLAFQIIWIIVGFVQLIYILKNLGALPTAARGPYILLAVVTLCLTLYNISAAVLTRVDFTDFMTSSNVNTASSFFWDVDAAFRPALPAPPAWGCFTRSESQHEHSTVNLHLETRPRLGHDGTGVGHVYWSNGAYCQQLGGFLQNQLD